VSAPPLPERVVVTGGGSAGHVVPALPVIEKLLAAGREISFFGSTSGLEERLVAPLGMLLGTCFPACLRLGGMQRAGIVPWLWAVNGFFSVLGSVGAVALGMEWGVSASLAVGAAAYVVAGSALFWGSRRMDTGAEVMRPAGTGPWAAVLLLVALLWYAAFSFIGVRYWGAAPSANHPRPPVAAEVWPDALRAF